VKNPLLLLLLIPFAALSLASCDRFSHHKGHGYWIDKKISHVADKLDLTEPQEKQLLAIKDEVKAMHQKHRQGNNWHEGLIAEIKKDKIDPKTIEQMAQAHQSHRQEMMTLLAQRLSDFHATLSKEQKEKLIQLLEKVKDKYGH